MPHKYRLPTSSKRASNYDLPPTTIASPLSVRRPRPSAPSTSKAPTSKPTTLRNKISSTSTSKSTNPSSSQITKSPRKAIPRTGKRKGKEDDDTPRAFTRLLSSYHPPPRSGLDDGPPPSKKLKTSKAASTTTSAQSSSNPTPATTTTAQTSTILPHESLSAYGARIDAMLPISGLGKAKGRGTLAELKGLKGLEGRKTKAERKMQKMHIEWRAEEARRKAKREEMREEKEMEDDNDDFVGGVGVRKGKGKRGKKGSDEDGNLWAGIGQGRVDDLGVKETGTGKEKGGGLVGLHDVVLAPPKFAKPPKEKFRDKTDGRKNGVLGLKRQGELSDARQRVIEGYRALMKEKGGEGTQ